MTILPSLRVRTTLYPIILISMFLSSQFDAEFFTASLKKRDWIPCYERKSLKEWMSRLQLLKQSMHINCSTLRCTLLSSMNWALQKERRKGIFFTWIWLRSFQFLPPSKFQLYMKKAVITKVKTMLLRTSSCATLTFLTGRWRKTHLCAKMRF